MLVVSDSLLEAVENTLFQRTGVFDDQRKLFIREWQTCDLQAVPGSGKTTALLAKLIALEKLLPLKNGGSVLVLSHTNAAVNEIREKIGKHCPILFSEPHFIGTIQSFVDRFLAIPFYVNQYKKKPVRIDDELYAEHHQPNHKFKYWLDQQHNGQDILLKSRLIDWDTVSYAFSNDTFPLVTRTSASYQSLLNMKRNCMQGGFLCFDDAYILANMYLVKNQGIKTILQKRFHYVFVDEMQDMSKHQYDIIETIFGDGTSTSIIQRIGDTNQAIFHDDAKQGAIWVPRPNLLYLNGSHRLSPQIAAIVQNLALSPIRIDGQGTQRDGRPISLKPHILIYRDSNIQNVIGDFAQLIRKFRSSGDIPDECPQTYKAIGWSAKQETGKVRIPDFYPNYLTERAQPKIVHFGLESYLHLHQNTFRSVRKSILNALLLVLRKEGIQRSDGRIFTKRSLLSQLRDMDAAAYNDLKLKLFSWSRMILLNQHADVFVAFKVYLISFLGLWGKTILRARVFISQPYDESLQKQTKDGSGNCTVCAGIPIEIGTIHSVKGQTHTATLYLETFYQRSSGNYESERLANIIKGAALPAKLNDIMRQSIKMAYVGFSRPTHLLCFAVHEKRFTTQLNDLSTDIWEIVSVRESDASQAASDHG
ncbi:MAG: ATP-dependent helicase [Proteobacteria bacterium]|nr:MAG: ATP-dependent helicase [Pseudomonadota bacterium]